MVRQSSSTRKQKTIGKSWQTQSRIRSPRNISQQRRSHSKKKNMEPTQTTQLVHLTKRSNSVVHCTHYHITQEQNSIHYISCLRQQVPTL
jgi:hypothetical protein